MMIGPVSPPIRLDSSSNNAMKHNDSHKSENASRSPSFLKKIQRRPKPFIITRPTDNSNNNRDSSHSSYNQRFDSHDSKPNYYTAEDRGKVRHSEYSNRSNSYNSNPNYNNSDRWEEVRPSRHDRNHCSSNGRRMDQHLYSHNSNTNGSAATSSFISENVSTSNYKPFRLILVGIPGSGKSTFAKALAAGKPSKYVRINQDELKQRHVCETWCHQALKDGKCPVVDRCNFDERQRQHFIDIASKFGVPVDCIVFNENTEDCIIRCEERSYHETINKGNANEVVKRMAKSFDPPLPKSRDISQYRNVINIKGFQQSHDLVLEYLSSKY